MTNNEKDMKIESLKRTIEDKRMEMRSQLKLGSRFYKQKNEAVKNFNDFQLKQNKKINMIEESHSKKIKSHNDEMNRKLKSVSENFKLLQQKYSEKIKIQLKLYERAEKTADSLSKSQKNAKK